jgi:hypothetical protein
MTDSPSDSYYAEAVANFEHAGRRLDILAEQAPDSGELHEARLETYCGLAVCHWKHGRADQAEKTFRDRVRPLLPRDGGPAASLHQHLDALSVLWSTAERRQCLADSARTRQAAERLAHGAGR